MVYQIIFEFQATPFSNKLRVYNKLAVKRFEELKLHDLFENPKSTFYDDKQKKSFENDGVNVSLSWLNDNMHIDGFDLVMLTDKFAIFRLRSWWENFKAILGIRT